MQVIRVDGLVSSRFKNQWLERAGTAMGRFDGRTGVFSAHNDSAETAFTQRALTYIDREVYKTLAPPLKARNFIPTRIKGNPGDETYLWRKLTRVGMARLFARGASLDLPRASMYQEEITQRFYAVGVEIVYNYFELLAIGAALANGQPVDLIGESLLAAMEAIEKKLDIIAAFGTATPPAGFAIEVEADVGLTGLLNNPNTAVFTVPPGQNGLTTWASKTPDEIFLDLIGIVGAKADTTFEVHEDDTILVPIKQYRVDLQRRMSDVSNETVLSFFTRTQPGIAIKSWMYCARAGAGSTDVMVSYRSDERLFEHILAMDATPLPATTQKLETTQPVVAKTTGIVMRNPLSVSTGAGI